MGGVYFSVRLLVAYSPNFDSLHLFRIERRAIEAISNAGCVAEWATSSEYSAAEAGAATAAISTATSDAKLAAAVSNAST